MASWVSRLFRPSSALLGLDLTDHAAHLVELRQGRDLLMSVADTQPLPPDCVVDGHIQQFDALVLALRQLLQRHRLSTRDLAMALPATAVRRATWLAPLALQGASLDAWVHEQAALHWQTELQPLNLDYGVCPVSPHVLGSSLDSAKVWVAAAPLDAVQDRQGLAEACGLRLTALDDAAEAEARAWHQARMAQRTAGSDDVSEEPFLFDGLRLGPRLKEWPTQPSSYATACGLALRAFTP